MSGAPGLRHLAWQQVTVDGRAAAYGVAGDGPPLLFLHGWALNHRTYRRALRLLVRHGIRVYAPALPGFGGTADLPGDEFSFAGYSRWVAHFLDVVGVRGPLTVV